MNQNITLYDLDGFKNVMVYKNTKNRHKYVYCRAGGGQVKLNDKEKEKHTAICTSKFEPLCQGDPIPNGETSAFTNLQEHIYNGESL